MAYRCEQCGRVWDDQTAVENEFLCTRRCGGRCLSDDSVDSPPQKVYIELTTDCNMDCPMCIRHSWSEPNRSMSESTFDAVITQLSEMPSVKTVNFSGFGEPLTHPEFFTLAKRAKQAGLNVEMITNGLLLDSETIDQLIALPLNRLIVSLDSLSEPSGKMLHENSFTQVADSLRTLFHRRQLAKQNTPDINIEFVATKKNIHELPELRRLSLVLGFSRIIVTNLIPQTPQQADELLYGACGPITRGQEISPWQPCIDMPVMDVSDEVHDVTRRLSNTGVLLRVNGAEVSGAGSKCRFVDEGAFAICADGSLSPCLALMHSHKYYFRKQSKRILAYHPGNVEQTTIKEIWGSPEYRAFRDRVRKNEFAPCLDCGGCNLRDSNAEDCAGDVFPRCGECLWAAGWIQCP